MNLRDYIEISDKDITYAIYDKKSEVICPDCGKSRMGRFGRCFACKTEYQRVYQRAYYRKKHYDLSTGKVS